MVVAVVVLMLQVELVLDQELVELEKQILLQTHL
jgi:hypothetical protein